jgi:hypothetical protein
LYICHGRKAAVRNMKKQTNGVLIDVKKDSNATAEHSHTICPDSDEGPRSMLSAVAVAVAASLVNLFCWVNRGSYYERNG